MSNERKLVKVAVAQMSSGDRLERNLQNIKKLAAQASAEQVQLLLLPENAAHMPRTSSEQWIENEVELEKNKEGGEIQAFLADLAVETNLYIVVGSLGVRENGNDKPFARSLVFDPNGQIIQHYDKIHLFDVDVPNGVRYQESTTYLAGDVQQAVRIAKLSFANIGLTICYDLRFPELYRNLVNNGAQIICVPAAFTYETGQAHWQTLLQARAIENQVYILAAAQTGTHVSGRRTWGHSMIIDPWGKVIAQADEEVNKLVICQIDLTKQEQLRTTFPVLSHQRLN